MSFASIAGGLLGNALSGTSIGRQATNLFSNPIVGGLFRAFATSNGLTGQISSVINGGSVMTDAASDAQNRPDPSMGFHWSILPPMGFLPHYVEEVRIPLPTISPEPYHRANTKRYDPGFVDVGTMSVTFYADTRGYALDYLSQWKSLVVDNGFYGAPAEYKKSFLVTFHDSAGNPIVVFKSIGSWPTQITDITGSSDNPDRIRIECEFSCDDVIYQVAGSTSGFVSDLGIDLGSGISGSLRRSAINALGGFVSSRIGSAISRIF